MKDARLKRWKRKKKTIYYNSYNLIYVYSLIIFKISFFFFLLLSSIIKIRQNFPNYIINCFSSLIDDLWTINPFQIYRSFIFSLIQSNKKKDKWKRNEKLHVTPSKLSLLISIIISTVFRKSSCKKIKIDSQIPRIPIKFSNYSSCYSTNMMNYRIRTIKLFQNYFVFTCIFNNAFTTL